MLARLERESLEPSKEADEIALLRRVTYDLTGLPPTPADVDAFPRRQVTGRMNDGSTSCG